MNKLIIMDEPIYAHILMHIFNLSSFDGAELSTSERYISIGISKAGAGFHCFLKDYITYHLNFKIYLKKLTNHLI